MVKLKMCTNGESNVVEIQGVEVYVRINEVGKYVLANKEHGDLAFEGSANIYRVFDSLTEAEIFLGMLGEV